MPVTIQEAKQSPEAKAVFIEKNTALVRAIVSRYFRRVTNTDDYFDYVQIGIIGLIKAVNNFDLSLGLQFSTYAVPMILGEIRRHVRDRAESFGGVKVPRELKNKVSSVINDYQNGTSLEEALKTHGVSHLDYNIISPLFLSPVSLDETYFQSDGDAITVAETIASPIDTEEQALASHELSEKMALLRKYVPEHYIDILLLSANGKSQTQIARIVNTSQAQVSRILRRLYSDIIPLVNQYYDGEISEKRLNAVASRLPASRGEEEGDELTGMSVRSKQIIEAIVQWAQNHPGDKIVVGDICEEAGIDVPETAARSYYKDKALNILRSKGYQVKTPMRGYVCVYPPTVLLAPEAPAYQAPANDDPPATEEQPKEATIRDLMTRIVLTNSDVVQAVKEVYNEIKAQQDLMCEPVIEPATSYERDCMVLVQKTQYSYAAMLHLADLVSKVAEIANAQNQTVEVSVSLRLV